MYVTVSKVGVSEGCGRVVQKFIHPNNYRYRIHEKKYFIGNRALCYQKQNIDIFRR